MKKGILIFAAVVLIIVGIWWSQIDWDVRAVKERLNDLVEQVEKDGPASTFETLGRARKVTKFFKPDASIEYYPGRRLPRDLDAMQGAFVQIWGRLDTATVWIEKHSVELDPEGKKAVSSVQATSRVIMGGRNQMGDPIDYQIHWVKVDGDWLIQSVVVEPPE